MNTKKILFLYLCITSSVISCGNHIVNFAIFVEKDSKYKEIKILREDNKKIYVSQEEAKALQEDTETIKNNVMYAIEQEVDVVVVSAALIRCLVYLDDISWDYWPEKKFDKIKKFDIYKTKKYRFAVLVSKKSKNRLGDTLVHMGLNPENLEHIEGCDKEEFYTNFKERAYGDPVIDDLESIFAKDVLVKKIVFLQGHGGYRNSIANLDIEEYIKLLDILQSNSCVCLYVDSCDSGGKNSIDVHSKLKKIIFPIIHLAFTDKSSWQMSKQDYNGFYRNLHMFFAKNKVINQSFLHNSLVKKAFSSFNGLEKYNIDKILFVHGIFYFICGGILYTKTDIFCLALGCMGVGGYGVVESFFSKDTRNKRNFGGILSVFLPYDTVQNALPSQHSFILDDKAMEIDHCQASQGYPIVVRNKNFLLIKPIIIDGTIKIEGSKMPICFSMIQDSAYHYIEKIEAKNITLDQIYKKFLAKKVKSAKLFVIGKIVCKNFDKSGLLHSEDKSKDTKKQDLVVFDCRFYKPKGNIKNYSKAICVFVVKKNGRYVLMRYNGLKEVEEVKNEKSLGKYYLGFPVTVSDNALYISGNSQACKKRCLKRILRSLDNACDEDKEDEPAKEAQEVVKKEKTKSWFGRNKGVFAMFAISGFYMASSFLLNR